MRVKPAGRKAIDNGDRRGKSLASTEAKSNQNQPKEGHMAERILEKIATPPAVESLIAEMGIADPNRCVRTERNYKLSYYFGGMDVACRDTPGGTLIVASGPSNEVAEKLRTIPDGELDSIYLERPPLWETISKVKHHSGARRNR